MNSWDPSDSFYFQTFIANETIVNLEQFLLHIINCKNILVKGPL